MPTALIIFDQTGPGPAGEALEGTLAGGAVTVTNNDNTGVVSWTITLLDAPPNSTTYPSTPTVLGSAVSGTPSANFTPDVAGSYRIQLEVVDGGLVSDIDIRNFGVRNGRNIIIPPYQQVPPPRPLTGPLAKPDEQNYGGQSRGWAGDGASGQLQEFMTTYDDIPRVVVSSTSYFIDPDDPPMIYVDHVTAGGDVTVTMPDGSLMRQGQRVLVVSRNSGSYNTIIAVPALHTINETFTTWTLRPGMTAEIVFINGSDYIAADASLDRYERSVVANTADTDQTGFVTIGATYIDTGDFVNLNGVTWEAIIETTNAADAAEIRLYNVTTAAVVASSTLSTTNLTPTLVSAAITLDSGPNLYEAQLRLQTTGAPNRATCKQARVILEWFQ